MLALSGGQNLAINWKSQGWACWEAGERVPSPAAWCWRGTDVPETTLRSPFRASALSPGEAVSFKEESQP